METLNYCSICDELTHTTRLPIYSNGSESICICAICRAKIADFVEILQSTATDGRIKGYSKAQNDLRPASKLYCVYDNGKPASIEGFTQLKFHGWNTNKFKTLDEANKYVDLWLSGWLDKPLKVGEQFDYSGYGDIIEIREEKI